MSTGPIPWDKIVDYAHLKGFDDEMTDVFVEVLFEMDVGYLAWIAAQREKPGG